MASTADLFRGALQTAASGGKLDSNTVDSANTGTTSNGSVTQEGEVVTSQESDDNDILPGGDEKSTQKDDQETADVSAETRTGNQDPSVRETIVITDEQGRKRKVEVDFSDRKAIRKAFEMAGGARKWQSERDQARQETAKERAARTELKQNWDALEAAYQKGGEGGVIDLLAGRQGAHQAWVKREIDKHKFLESASPEEVQAFQEREKADGLSKEVARMKKENEDFRKQMTETKEQAEMRSLESRVNPVFDKYRFADKLGDANDEHMFDEMLWNSALKRLEPYEAQGLEITQELVDREFRSVATALRKRIGVQADKKATRTLDQKKQEATENVQAKTHAQYKTGGVAKEARDLIESRNITGLLKNWSRYGGVFKK